MIDSPTYLQILDFVNELVTHPSYPSKIITTECYCTNDLLLGLLGPYWEIRIPIFFVLPTLARAVRKSEGFVFLVRTA